MTEAHIPLFDLLDSISDTVDAVSAEMGNHHKQVAYIAYNLAREMGLEKPRVDALLIAGSMHDIGAFSLLERQRLQEFEVQQPHTHALWGAHLLQTFPPFARAATLVQYHHLPWNNGAGPQCKGESAPFDAHVLHLADRVAILLSDRPPVLAQVDGIRQKIRAEAGRMFHPDMVEAFDRLAQRDSLWLDLATHITSRMLREQTTLQTLELNMDGLLALANLFRRMVDYRSRFTATHSSGVASTARTLAAHMGFSPNECTLMQIAGYLHDLGKIAVPREILEKNGPLTADEAYVMRSHVFYTHRVLLPIRDLALVRDWAAFHHEFTDGRGYPFRVAGPEIPMGSRIMAAADMFTALTEDRPYRRCMSREEALAVMERQVNRQLDAHVVSLLRTHFDELNHLRDEAQRESEVEYRQLLDSMAA